MSTIHLFLMQFYYNLFFYLNSLKTFINIFFKQENVLLSSIDLFKLNKWSWSIIARYQWRFGVPGQWNYFSGTFPLKNMQWKPVLQYLSTFPPSTCKSNRLTMLLLTEGTKLSFLHLRYTFIQLTTSSFPV